jgi:Phage integrase family
MTREVGGAALTRASHMLDIKDLRFHDLRHEATSRLFECSYQIHEVAQFTLHDSWNELKRYANLRPEDLRDITALTIPDGSPRPCQVNCRLASRIC